MNNDLRDRLASLRRMVDYGVRQGKKNLIVDLDLLAELFRELEMIREMAADDCRSEVGGNCWQIEAEARAALGMPLEEEV